MLFPDILSRMKGKFTMKMELNRNNIFAQLAHIFISKVIKFILCLLIVFMLINHGYDVHHLNQIKTDNRLQNLVYLTRAEHTKLHNLGKKYSTQTKAKIGASRKGRKHSEQSKEKISASKKGKTSYWKGKTRSEQTKQKMSVAKKKKQVYCVQLNKVFESVNIAGRELSLHVGNIILCCQGKRKTCGGYHFQYYKGELI